MMLNRIPFLFAFNTLLVLTTGVLMYHFLILTEVIPFTAVWGGRLRTQDEMIQLESLSILVNALFLMVLYLKIRRYRAGQSVTWINATLWLFVVLYLLNTLGNLVSFSSLETIVFTPLTLILALFTARLALEKSFLSHD
jgi:hypothetical protein